MASPQIARRWPSPHMRLRRIVSCSCHNPSEAGAQMHNEAPPRTADAPSSTRPEGTANARVNITEAVEYRPSVARIDGRSLHRERTGNQ